MDHRRAIARLPCMPYGSKIVIFRLNLQQRVSTRMSNERFSALASKRRSTTFTCGWGQSAHGNTAIRSATGSALPTIVVSSQGARPTVALRDESTFRLPVPVAGKARMVPSCAPLQAFLGRCPAAKWAASRRTGMFPRSSSWAMSQTGNIRFGWDLTRFFPLRTAPRRICPDPRRSTKPNKSARTGTAIPNVDRPCADRRPVGSRHPVIPATRYNCLGTCIKASP